MALGACMHGAVRPIDQAIIKSVAMSPLVHHVLASAFSKHLKLDA